MIASTGPISSRKSKAWPDTHATTCAAAFLPSSITCSVYKPHPPTTDRRGWQRTVVVQRDAIDQLLEENPSLRPSVPATITKALPKAREIAALALAEYAETPAVPLDQLSYTTEQVLGPWMPDDAE